jgi:ribosomal protein L37AE/L43A
MAIYPEINSTKFYPAKDNRNILGRFFDRKRGEDKDGKEVFATYCEIEISGDKYTKPCNIINSESKEIERFPEAWKEFKTGIVEENGTSLLDLDAGVDGINLALWRKGYRTIEVLAECDEDSIGSFGIDYRKVHRKAVEWVKSKREATVDKLAPVAEKTQPVAEKTQVGVINCAKCGKEFTPANKMQKYCSKECRGSK